MFGDRGGVAISLVAHTAAVLALGRVAWKVEQPARAAPEAPVVVWFGEWGRSPARGDQQGPDEADSEPSARVEPSLGPETPIEAAPGPAQDSAAAESPEPEPLATAPSDTRAERGPAVDWSEARRRAIDDVVDEASRAASYRSFAFPGTIGEELASDRSGERRREAAGAAPVRTVFDSPAKGRAGLAEENALGEYVVWISDDCYRTFGTRNAFVLPSAQGLYDAPMTSCVGYAPRDDLFADQKPSYLMGAEEIEQRQKRWRRNDTGAVATFGD